MEARLLSYIFFVIYKLMITRGLIDNENK